MEHIKNYELFESENTKNPENLKDLKKVMRKASTEKSSGVYGMFALPTGWGNFQFIQNDSFWLDKGEMSVMTTGNITGLLKIVNNFLNPLGWEMVNGEQQRTVNVKKLA
jgi:hypothetical protein